MSISGYHGDVQYTASPQISFTKCHRTPSKELRLCPDLCFQTIVHFHGQPKMPTFLAHKTLSKRAPVAQNRLNHTRIGSSQAVILFANSGTKRRCSSASVRVQTNAAMRPPADVPVMTRGIKFASRKAFTTPKWSRVMETVKIHG